MNLHNALCRRLGIRWPIFGLAHRIEVAAAISRAGGLGVYAAARDGPDELAAKIAQVRKQGWSMVNQELEEGLVSMAAAITDRTGQTVAALNISGQANRTSAKVMQETMLPALLETAQRISERLSLQRS